VVTEQRQRVPELRNAERLKFFTDAVVAIAMTLLILPLLESVAEAARDQLATTEYLADHRSQLLSFVLSFVAIATFWISHERLYSQVRSWHGLLVVLNFAWMFTIVFLPVVTALVGSFNTDNALLALYVGTMLATSILMAAMNLVIRGTPALWEEGAHPGVGGLSASLALTILFTLALIVGLLLPQSGKLFAMFLLFLTGPVQRLIRHGLERREQRSRPPDAATGPGRVRVQR
jgi:uncharacterized membrane protein